MSIEEKATAAQENLESKFSKLGTGKYGRIIKMCRTPSTEEYKRSLLIVAAGLAVLGVVGFGLYWLMSYLPILFFFIVFIYPLIPPTDKFTLSLLLKIA